MSVGLQIGHKTPHINYLIFLNTHNEFVVGLPSHIVKINLLCFECTARPRDCLSGQVVIVLQVLGTVRWEEGDDDLIPVPECIQSIDSEWLSEWVTDNITITPCYVLAWGPLPELADSLSKLSIHSLWSWPSGIRYDSKPAWKRFRCPNLKVFSVYRVEFR